MFTSSSTQEILFLKIWENGSLSLKEAPYEAFRNLIYLLFSFLHKEEENLPIEGNQHTVLLFPSSFYNKLDKLRKKNKNSTKIDFYYQFELSPRVYNSLKRFIYTLFNLLNNGQEDRMKIEHFS